MTLDIADRIKSDFPQLPIIAGGVHVTNAPENVLRESDSIDFISLYEGDKSFCDFLEVVNKKKDINHLSQIGTLIDNQYIPTQTRGVPEPEIMNIIPDYLDLPIGQYDSYGEVGTFRYWRSKNSRSSTSLSNRGCRARCSFCSVINFNGPPLCYF